MNKKNKILIFHPYFRFGGVERTNLRLSKIFLQNDYEVEIITFK